MQALAAKVSEISVTVADHSTRLDTPEQVSRRHEQEIRDLKDMHYAAPQPKLKINGISLCLVPCPPLDRSHKFFDSLDLQLLFIVRQLITYHYR